MSTRKNDVKKDKTKVKVDEDDDELTRLALEELTRGAERAKERVNTMGALGWKKNPIPPANKRYLQNTIIGALHTNKRIEKNPSRKPEDTAQSSSSSRDTSTRNSRELESSGASEKSRKRRSEEKQATPERKRKHR